MGKKGKISDLLNFDLLRLASLPTYSDIASQTKIEPNI